MSLAIIFRAFPLPISTNNAYRNVIGGSTGRVKTNEYKRYERDVRSWAIVNSRTINEARDSLLANLKAGTVIESEYLFRQHSLFMKSAGVIPTDPSVWRKLKGEPRKNDTSNRIKVLEDVLSAILGVDDCWFWSGSYHKIEEPKAFPESVDIILRFRRIDERGEKLVAPEDGPIPVRRGQLL